jgi:hypothetical protein
VFLAVKIPRGLPRGVFNDALFFGFSAHRFELENLVPTFSEMEGTN